MPRAILGILVSLGLALFGAATAAAQAQPPAKRPPLYTLPSTPPPTGVSSAISASMRTTCACFSSTQSTARTCVIKCVFRERGLKSGLGSS